MGGHHISEMHGGGGQVPFRYEEKAGTPPRIRTGYYFLPSGWYNTSLPVMMLFHGLAGYGVSILNAGSQGTFQVGACSYLCAERKHYRTLNSRLHLGRCPQLYLS